jgi:hypothetical protein
VDGCGLAGQGVISVLRVESPALLPAAHPGHTIYM